MLQKWQRRLRQRTLLNFFSFIVHCLTGTRESISELKERIEHQLYEE